MIASGTALRCLSALGLMILIAQGCGTSPPSTSADLSFGAESDLRSAGFDAARPASADLGSDQAMPPSCPTVASYCADPSNPCVLDWPAANAPAAWCSGTRTFNVLPESTACPSGDHLLVLSNELAFGTKYFLYRGGSLVAVLGFPDDLSTGLCLAGDASVTQADLSNCLGNTTVAQCVDGALQ